MISRIVFAVGFLVLAAASVESLPSRANLEAQLTAPARKQPTLLKCTVERSPKTKTQVLVTIYNNATKPIPKGTRINWVVSAPARLGHHVKEGSFILERQAPPGQVIKTFHIVFNPQPEPPPGDPEPWAPTGKAWYYPS